MPLYDEKGQVVENVVPKEEAEAMAKKAADDAVATANQEKAQLQTQLDKVNEDLKKAGEGDKNWGELRKTKEELEGKIGEIGKKLEDKEKAETDRLVGESDTSFKNRIIMELADGNKELAEKIKHYYSSKTAGEEVSEESIRTRANNAYVLLKNEAAKNPGILGGAVISSGGGGSPRKSTGQVSPEAESLGAKMGIADRIERHKKRHNQSGK